jgi:hypothetical protein
MRRIYCTISLIVFVSTACLLSADGTSELDRLLRDRPSLAPVLNRHPSLRTWLVDAFDGKFSKAKITWRDDDSSMKTPFGEHSYDANGNAFVIISRKSNPIDQLAVLVYECVSVQHRDAWARLWTAGATRMLDRQGFVRIAFGLENEVCVEASKILLERFRITHAELAQALHYKQIVDGSKVYGEDPFPSYSANKAAVTYYESVYDQLAGNQK